MRMIDVVRIGNILAGVMSSATSHTERRQRRRLVPAESFITLRPKAAPGLRRIFAMLGADTQGGQQMAQKPDNEREEGDANCGSGDNPGLRPHYADAPIALAAPSLWKFRVTGGCDEPVGSGSIVVVPMAASPGSLLLGVARLQGCRRTRLQGRRAEPPRSKSGRDSKAMRTLPADDGPPSTPASARVSRAVRENVGSRLLRAPIR